MYNKEYQKKWRQEHKEKTATYMKDYHSNNKEKHNLNSKKYFYEHKDRLTQVNEEWRSNNLDYSKNYYQKNLKYFENYYKENKEKIINRIKKYNNTLQGKLVRKSNRQNRRDLENLFSKVTPEKLLKMEANNILKHGVLTCELCFKPVSEKEKSLDHLIPLTRFKDFPNKDLNALDNLGVAHFNCNAKKKSKTLEEWFKYYLKV